MFKEIRRDDFVNLIEMIERDEIDVVIVRDVDRLTRHLPDWSRPSGISDSTRQSRRFQCGDSAVPVQPAVQFQAGSRAAAADASWGRSQEAERAQE